MDFGARTFYFFFSIKNYLFFVCTCSPPIIEIAGYPKEEVLIKKLVAN
jgi:hypothetical protein